MENLISIIIRTKNEERWIGSCLRKIKDQKRIKSEVIIVDNLSKDKRMIMIIGPCSIHNIEEAKIYGNLLKRLSNEIESKILVIMRVYFEKPRTTKGWKGLINDPHLDDSFDVNEGLSQARELLLYLNKIKLPCAYEILDTITDDHRREYVLRPDFINSFKLLID